MASIWLNGALVPTEQARISLFDHGLLYGDGVFEGIRFYQRRGFHTDTHLRRLFDSARALRLSVPYSKDELIHAIQQTIDGFDADNGYLRLVITRGTGPLGLDPGLCLKPTVFIIADQLAVFNPIKRQQGLRLVIASTRRLPLDGLDPRIKSLNYLNHALARMEASRADADEAILLNQQGYVTEGSTDNIFIVKNGCLLTPPVSDGALDGVTRSVVLQLAHQHGIESREVSLAPYDLYTADECFLTGTAIELAPVCVIDDRPMAVCPGPVFSELSAAFTALTAQHAGLAVNV
ncbi:MAG: branched-chain-amino-acid transaminase [Gammaproteobacteria bacterium]|nr:branched-chain-amino-acid transaminase [Gammaproteobacteria bacterium]